MSIEDLHKRVDAEIGDGEWWKQSTGETFRESAADLSSDTGWDDDRIIAFLSRLHGAVAEEYGD